MTITSDDDFASINVKDNNATTITPNATSAILIDFPHAAEKATYTFSFISDSAVESGDLIWVFFPTDYDQFLGDADNLYSNTEPGTYYLSCSSSSLGSIQCAANHRILVISKITTKVEALSKISISVWYISNPDAGTTGEFRVYHLNSKSEVISYTEEFGSATILALPETLTLKDVKITSNELRDKSDYTFSFYLDQTLTSDHAIYVNFPGVYDLLYSRGDIDSTCASVYYDESKAENSTTPLP